MTNSKPVVTDLRTFGCRVYARNPGKRPAKIDYHTSNGIFVGFAATTKNIYYIDDKTLNVKISTHATFDEAYFTSPPSKTPLAAQTLQYLGYSAFRDKYKNGRFKSKCEFTILMTTKDAAPPTLGKST